MADDELSLDFTLPGAIATPVEAVTAAGPEPVPEPEPPVAPAAQPLAPPALPPLPAALIEAATLHAEGKPLDAMRRLENALKSREPLGDNELAVWGGLFDLLGLLGREAAFYSLAVAFTKRFERSPPMWAGSAPNEAALPKSSDGIVLSGVLDAGIATPLKQALALAQRQDTVRLDLGGLEGAEPNGATLLMRLVSGLRKSKKRAQFIHPERLAGLLQPLVAVGRREHEPLWLLLLELYQQAGAADAYEETAINYAVTFEVSPPAWVAPEQPMTESPPSEPKENRRFSLSGTLTDTPLERFQSLEPLHAADSAIELDARELARIDAASAARLLAALQPLADAGKSVRLTGLAPLVAAFLRTQGLATAATLQTRSL